MRTRLLYASASATADNIATYDVVSSTRLLGVQWAVHFTSITAASNSVILLSKSAASQFATNNIPDVLSVFVMNSNFVTSGLAQPQGNFLAPVDVNMKTGDRIAIHYQETGTVVAAIYCLLYFSS